MKFIKPFHLFETKTSKILYHGSPYIFKDFKNRETFFSDTPKFAIDYAEQKSFDSELDSEPNLYTVEVIAKIFDINKEEDYNKIYPLLPEKIEYSYNNFGFTGKVEKEEFLFNMKGYEHIEPHKEATETAVGDTFPNPEYPSESFIVIKKDKNYSYVKLKRMYYDDIYETLQSSYVDRYFYSSKEKIKDIFKPLIELLKNYLDSVIGNKYEDSYKKVELYQKIINSPQLVDKNFIGEYNKLFKICEEKYRNYLVDNEYCRKFILKPEVIELSNTWRFYENETITETIKKLGYCGYVAKEEKVNTYNIFNPSESCRIIKYEFPRGYQFDTFEDYKKFNVFANQEYKKNKTDRYDSYQLFKKL